MLRSSPFLIVFALLLAACSSDRRDLAHDYFTFANMDDVVAKHLDLDLAVDFDASELQGTATLHMQALARRVAEVVLDSRGLDIREVKFAVADEPYESAEFHMGETDPVLGTPLVIALPEKLSSATEFRLEIAYRTGPNASALQWLPAKLTAGGDHPMMFTQSQAIHARSWVPLQDTPAVRVTYSAAIHTPPELLAVMSADNDPLAARDGEYQFEMPQPIPPYLLALAVGNIYFAPLGDETGVYAEPEILDAAAFEFSNTQQMLDTAVELFGSYDWGRYDLLVLPPSFPYGGMENPRLSFVTPSLLAGDHSLVSVIAHELAHSWSGNLVTNATWRDQWLNEGMTNYLESRLMEVLYDKDRVDEEAVLDYRELLQNFERVVPALQALAPRTDIGDADGYQGTIHYTKGRLLLQYLENAFGRSAFDQFLDGYFEKFAFGTITTEQFLDYLQENLLQRDKGKVSRQQVEAWLYEPGLPDDAPIPTSATLDTAAAMALAWSQQEIASADIPVAEWSPQATVYFIKSLPAGVTDTQLSDLDDALGFSGTRNAEVSNAWFVEVAKRQHRVAYDAMERHLNQYGRLKFIYPVYMALAANSADLELAREMFARARDGYHPIAVNGLTKILKLNSD